MKTLKQVLAENKEYESLIKAVIRQVGKESIPDVLEHGADTGFDGFIYYDDTNRFFNRHKKQILKLAEELASGIGTSLFELIRNFNCLKDLNLSDNDIGLALYTRDKSDTSYTIRNGLAWFALEEVARMFEE